MREEKREKPQKEEEMKHLKQVIKKFIRRDNEEPGHFLERIALYKALYERQHDTLVMVRWLYNCTEQKTVGAELVFIIRLDPTKWRKFINKLRRNK